MLAFLLANASMKAQDYLDDIMFQSFGWDEFAQTRVSNEGGFVLNFITQELAF